MDMTQTKNEARRVNYRGRVQGVGFRYTAHRIAQRYAVTGYVKNLRDGSVELVVEGAATEIQRMLTEIAAEMAGNIETADVQSEPASGRYSTFEVAF
jgi:acylphosphatase